MDLSTPSDEKATPFETTLWILVALTMLVTPFVIMRPALDVFRTPKDVLFQTMALAIFALGAAGALLSNRIARGIRMNRSAVAVAAAGVLWTAVSTITSLNPVVSYFKPLNVFCLAVFFAAAMWATWNRGIGAIALVIAPALVNAVVAFMQSAGSSKFTVVKAVTRRMGTSGFIGNPNELGGYLVLPLLAAIVATMTSPRPRRSIFGAAAILLAGGIVASQSVTPILATVAGLAAILLLPGKRKLRWISVGALVFLIGAASLHPGARARAGSLVQLARAGDLDQMMSLRLPAFSVALQMFRERPILGVGPGVFSARYMLYKLRLDASHPKWIRVGNQNFGEVHNDHLQLLAETGLPGYLLFVTALALLARLSFTHQVAASDRERFVRSFAFPATAAFAVLALAHFPMQLTSTMLPAVFCAALCFGWTTPDEIA